jgi:hypothetical protein
MFSHLNNLKIIYLLKLFMKHSTLDYILPNGRMNSEKWTGKNEKQHIPATITLKKETPVPIK